MKKIVVILTLDLYTNATISPRIVLSDQPGLDQIVPINQFFEKPDCRPESPLISSPPFWPDWVPTILTRQMKP